jgi:hypothetical protein
MLMPTGRRRAPWRRAGRDAFWAEHSDSGSFGVLVWISVRRVSVRAVQRSRKQNGCDANDKETSRGGRPARVHPEDWSASGLVKRVLTLFARVCQSLRCFPARADQRDALPSTANSRRKMKVTGPQCLAA